MEKWNEKVAVVTGGSSGVGLAIVAKLLANNIKVIVLDINEPKKSEKNAFYRRCDVSDRHSIQSAFSWIEATFGAAQILVNCAGVCFLGALIDESEETSDKIDKTIDVNMRGYIHCAREAIALMRKSQDAGMVVNIGSIYGHGIPFQRNSVNAYGCTKHAIRALTEIVRQELVTAGCHQSVRISSVSPSSVCTGMWTAMGVTEDFMRTMNFLRPEDVADAVVYVLTTPLSINVTELVIRPVGEEF